MDITKTLKNAGALLAYPLAFAYLKFFLFDFSGDYTVVKRLLFVLGYILVNELIVRGRGRTPARETYCWYAVMVLVALTSVTGISEPVSLFGLHLCAIYVAVVGSGILYEGRTGSFIAADMFNSGVLKAFPGIPNLFKDIGDLKSKDKEKASVASVVGGIVGVLVMIPIFIVAVALLCGINSSFDVSVTRVLNSITNVINLRWLIDNFGFFVLALPASLYLYGMMSSCAGSDGLLEKESYQKLSKWREACRKVSPILSTVVMGCFVVLYIIFFVFEGSYLFSAFFGRLPEEFTAAEYARQGFFELTGIMFINMLVFLLVSYFSRRDAVARKVSSVMTVALMSESVVFAVVSFSKLALYYSRFGYTPKRLLAMWGTLIFAAGAIMVIGSTLKRKDLSRAWIYFATGSFVVMNIVSSVIYLIM